MEANQPTNKATSMVEHFKPVGHSEFSEEQIALIKSQIAPKANNDELKMFLSICKKTRLDPFTRQIYCVSRWDSIQRKETMSFQISIDGMRLVAERTGEYQGQTKAEWCGEDGEWVDVWTNPEEPPYAAKVGVWRKNFREATYGVALWNSYVQKKKDGEPNYTWSKMPDLMLAKCAESLALRKAFPNELSGLYSSEEMSSVSEDTDSKKEVEKKLEPKQIEIPAAGPRGTDYINRAQQVALFESAKIHGWDTEEFKQLIFDKTGHSNTGKLRYIDFSYFMSYLETHHFEKPNAAAEQYEKVDF